MAEKSTIQSMLFAYPQLDTQKKLSAACETANSILLCGKASDAQAGIARLLSYGVSGGGVLHLALSFGRTAQGARLPCGGLDQKKFRQWLQENTTSFKDVDTIKIGLRASALARDRAVLRELLLCAGDMYAKTLVSVSDNGRLDLRLLFPVHTDTLLLLPKGISYGKMKGLLQEIYEQDYTIAGVVEEKIFADLHQPVMV